MAKVKETELRNVEESDLIAQVKKYSFLKSQLDYLEKEQKEERLKLFDVLDSSGEEDSKGNIFLELPEEVDGYTSIIKERRVSRKINEPKAEEIIEAKGLQDKLFKTVRVIDEDALMAALYNDELTAEEIEEMYPQSVIWALKLKK